MKKHMEAILCGMLAIMPATHAFPTLPKISTTKTVVGAALAAGLAAGAYAAYQWLTHPLQTEEAKHLIAHANVIGELKEAFKDGHFTRTASLAAQASSGPSDEHSRQKTQTEAYLSVPQLASLVDSTWARQRVLYGYMIKPMLAREREHNNDYYVFYHGQKREFCVLQDLLKEIYRILNLREPLDTFVLLRPWHEACKQASITGANGFIDDRENTWFSSGWNDNFGSLRRDLLSVNLSLFGNTSMRSGGECSFSFFEQSQNANYISVDSLVSNVFSQYGLSRKYISRVYSLIQRLISPEGIILQIFVPKSKVDQYVYLSEPNGHPDRACIDSSTFDETKHRHTKISTILELYKNHPEQISGLDTLQARMIFFPACLNPDSGIKIYRYMTVPDEVIAVCDKEIKQLAQEIVTDLLARRLSYKNIGNSDIYGDTGLVRLLTYRE